MGHRYDALIAALLRLVGRERSAFGQPTQQEIADAVKLAQEGGSGADDRARQAAERALDARHRPGPSA